MTEHTSGPPSENVEPEENGEPVIRDKRRIDPDTGEVREAAGEQPSPAAGAEPLSEEDIAILDEAEADLVAEMRDRAARAEAELANFRMRVERDRGANRDAVIAEVIRAMLPAMDDLDRAEAHGDLGDGTPLALVAQKIRGGFERFGLRRVGEKGEPFDPALHEAMMQLPTPGVETETVADVIEPGYALGERLVRAARVAVAVPAPDSEDE